MSPAELAKILERIQAGRPITAPQIEAVTARRLAYCVWTDQGPQLHLKERGREQLQREGATA